MTPQPPTTPKSSYSRNQASPINTPTHSSSVPTFKENYTNRPPRPLVRSKKNENGHGGSSVDPSIESIDMADVKNNKQNGYYPMPPSGNNSNPNKLRQRSGWTGAGGGGDGEREKNTFSVSSDRVPSALKLSRASSRNSFASEDLEKYMQPNKPIPQPRLTPSTRQPSGTNRILSGRSQDSSFRQIYDTPPPVKPRKMRSSSYTNMNSEGEESELILLRKEKSIN